MMFPNNRGVCFILTLLYFTVRTENRIATKRSMRVSITPRRLYVFQSPVRLTFSNFGNDQRQENITRSIKIKILNDNNQDVWTINGTVRFFNHTTFDVPCEIFSKSGRFHIHYFIEGVTRKFREMKKKIVVLREKIRLTAPKNHTAVSGSVAVWISNKEGRCKPQKDRVQLYWIKGVNSHILVTSKKIDKGKSGKLVRVQFDCNIFDTEGIFYFKYISGNSKTALATSNNMSVSWGKYKMEAQSNNIFPCAVTFAVKFTSPYCTKSVEDKVEIRSKDYDSVIATRSAYPGFRSVFLPCTTFKRYIRNYCFYYITKSSLTKTETIQTKLCLPSLRPESPIARWTEWTEWGSCFSPTADCGQGRKIRLRFCEITSSYSNTDYKPCGKGPTMDSTLCTLPPCKIIGCKSCGCVFTKPDGTIASPDDFTSTSIKSKSNCRWWIKVEANKKVKLWFDTLRLEKNSVIHIIDGNHSNSKILERVTHDKQKTIGDIFGSSNIISISYYFDGNLNGTKSGFQLSYSSVEISPTNNDESSSSEKKKLVKMTFIGILALMVVVMAVIFLVIFCKVRQRSCDEKSKTSVPTSSFHTSTACMSDTTLRSSFETPVSGDEGMNNNLTLQRANYRTRASRPARMENRTCVHVCPKCHDTDICQFEYTDSGNNLYQDLGSLSPEESARLTSYGGSHYRPVVDSAAARARHYQSAIESFRTASPLSDEAANRHCSRYL